MRKNLIISILTVCSTFISCSQSIAQPMHEVKNFYDLSARTINGDLLNFDQLKGKRVLIVNTASACGFTYQYNSLQKLWDESDHDEFVIIGFPCNDFGEQESGSLKEIESFCQKNYGVTFLSLIHI